MIFFVLYFQSFIIFQNIIFIETNIAILLYNCIFK